ncbi:hypothetical protein N2K95_00415 [Arthrobacter zhaoxinii]|uniref:Uncharacterized protein n=1 Tax=Arthrobacter zhaoxinii TaxID=2964616 RepID=A0ABY5YSE9_9MICC|nr:hypothetical protein [Arthrobacter zhaoxinii]UWX97214.1 hypothetical protein N2K95_00415 [Arthrobacter zhaoxinii]
MTSQEHVPRPDRRPLLPLLFSAGVLLLGLWAAWLTHSWIVLGAAVFVALFPARTHAGDVRAWARRRTRRGH